MDALAPPPARHRTQCSRYGALTRWYVQHGPVTDRGQRVQEGLRVVRGPVAHRAEVLHKVCGGGARAV
jgi:hypothetical protein